MAKKRTKTINISITPGTFSYLFRRFRGEKSDYEFSELSDFRQILSNEKAKILYSIKNDKPESIYRLAKILKRDFKSVRDDVKVLEKVGFIELVKESKGQRKKLKPVLVIDSLHVVFDI